MNPFKHDARGSMHEARVARIYAANNGRCHNCGRDLRPNDDYEIDHKIALSCGGTDDDDNLAPICEGCHIIKTKDDVTQAARIKRVATKHTVPAKFRKKHRWGGR